MEFGDTRTQVSSPTPQRLEILQGLFNNFYLETVGALRSRMFKRFPTCTRDDREEIIVTGYMRHWDAYRKADGDERQAPLRMAYLVRITHRVGLDRVRRQAPFAESIDAYGQEHGTIQELVSPDIEIRNIGYNYSEIIRELPQVQQEILVLMACEELSYAEVCEILHIRYGTLRSRYHRARRVLAEYLLDRPADLLFALEETEIRSYLQLTQHQAQRLQAKCRRVEVE